MNLPESLRILGMTWTVVSPNGRLDEDGLYGETVPSKNEIRISTQCPLQRQQESLIHEVIHAIDKSLMTNDTGLREEQVKILGVGLYQVIRDNPEFLEFIRWSSG